MGFRWRTHAQNDASPLICSSVSHMNSFATRHSHTHTCTHTDSPAVWPHTLFIALLIVCVYVSVCMRACECARACLCTCTCMRATYSDILPFLSTCRFFSRYICRLSVIATSVGGTVLISFLISANYPLNNHMHTFTPAHGPTLSLLDH